jgi:hypothetical protein
MMKATVEIPDELYRRVKAKSALQGRPVREVTVELFRRWVGAGEKVSAGSKIGSGERPPRWFGALRRYSANARGRHDMDSIRESIARGRARPRGGS